MNKNIFSIILILFASGCSTVGNQEFGCSGLPAGVSCTKASELYNVVDKAGYQPGYAKSKPGSGSDVTKDSIGRRESGRPDTGDDTRSGAPAQKFFGSVPEVPEGAPDQLFLLNPPRADGTAPVRMAPVMRRVWLAPWVDQDGVYHSDQVLYVDIKPEQWRNGEKASDTSPIFSPLN